MLRMAIISLLTLFCTFSFAQPNTVSISSKDDFKSNVLPLLIVRRIQSSIKIDGDLDDSGWVGASKASNFTETWPGDQTKPQVETEALITYNDHYLYIAFKCYDDLKTVGASLQ